MIARGSNRRAAMEAGIVFSLTLAVTALPAIAAVHLGPIDGGEVDGPKNDDADKTGREAGPIVFAAASLADVMRDLGERFQAQTGTRVRFHLGPSEGLATQILKGAPCDLFLAAGRAPMDRLDAAGRLAPGTRVDLLGNRLVVITPIGRGGAIQSLADLENVENTGKTRIDRITIGDPAVSPAGRYALQALEHSGVRASPGKRLVPAGDVRAALTFVASGEADAGIVYATDAAIEPRVRVAFPVPGSLHEPILYPVARIAGSARAAAAVRFLEFLTSPASLSAFARAGFETADFETGGGKNPRQAGSPDAVGFDPIAPLLISLRVAALSVLIGLPVALLFARLLTRRNFPGKLALETLLNLPLVLPPVASGYFLLLFLSREGPLGGVWSAAGVSLVFTWEAAALAAAVISFPLMLRAAQVSFESIDPRLPAMARTLGASRRRAFFSVTLPLALPGVLAAILLGFARSLGEFGATMMVAGNIPGVTQTLPMAIFTSVQVGSDRTAIGLCALSVLLAFGALAATRMIETMRRTGRTS